MPRPQPAWKPHLFAGRPRVVFTVREHVNCAMHKTASPLDVAFASCVLCKYVALVFRIHGLCCEFDLGLVLLPIACAVVNRTQQICKRI